MSFLRISSTRHAFLNVSSILYHLGLPACGFYLLLCTGGKDFCFNGQLFGQLTFSEDFKTIQLLTKNTVGQQRLHIDDTAVIKQLIQTAEVDDRVFLRKVVGKPALREFSVYRKLSALETRPDAATRARVLALMAPAGGLAVAAAGAPSFTEVILNGAGSRRKLVKLHNYALPFY